MGARRIRVIFDVMCWRCRTFFRRFVSNTCRSRNRELAYRHLACLANFPALETLDAIRQRREFSPIHLMDCLPAQIQTRSIGLSKNEIGLSLMMRAAGVISGGVAE